jgi:hypothetical protein
MTYGYILTWRKHIQTPFRPEKQTKCRVNDDPCILEKWSILDLLSTSRGAFYIGGKKTIDVVLCHALF